MSTPPRNRVITMGCRLNAVESEVIRGHLADDNTIVINSCAVTGEAVRQTRQTVRRTRKDHPQARLILTGCAAQLHSDAFAAMPEIDLILGNTEKLQAHSYGFGRNDRVVVNDIMAVRETAGHMIDGLSGRARAFVQAQMGCDHRCTFCIIPYARGPARSVPMGEVVRQIQHLVDNGTREVVLTGVDLTSYGPDLPGQPNLGQLVEKILTLVPDLPRLRLSSIDSIEVDDRLMELICGHERLMPHLHLSLQAGDDMILKRMKRRHSRQQSIAFCQAVRARRPEMVFGADLIAGFPTETEEMFENTLACVEEAGLSFLHVFPFSPRAGAPAAQMPQVPGEIIKARAAQLRAAGQAQQAKLFDSLVGQRLTSLIEKIEAGVAHGHTDQFAPVRAADLPLGITALTVTGHDGHTLRAEAAKDHHI